MLVAPAGGHLLVTCLLVTVLNPVCCGCVKRGAKEGERRLLVRVKVLFDARATLHAVEPVTRPGARRTALSCWILLGSS